MRDHPTAAMIFAAGFGTRMMPLTKDRPKPMVMVNERPLIDALAAANVTAISMEMIPRSTRAQKMDAYRTLQRAHPIVWP